MRRNNATASTLVLDAMRLAERVHRTRKQGPHLRKAPDGEDRPPYFIHLAEVGWMLQNAGLDAETVAAGYLHDVIEDCGYTKERLLKAIGNRRVVALVVLGTAVAGLCLAPILLEYLGSARRPRVPSPNPEPRSIR